MTNKEAIVQLEGMIKFDAYSAWEVEALKRGVSAIQEREEREKGCEYCKGRAYTKKPVTITTIYGKRISVVIEFCPKCGRPLKVGKP